jgi:transcriptional regulator
MYNLPHFKEPEMELVRQFVREHPFAVLAGCSADNEPVATQVPVFIDERDGKLFLTGHIMRNTDHQKAFANNSKVLAIFTGPHTYVSASWYKEKQQASTWNYMSVQARGDLRFLDEHALKEVLKRTTNHFEANPHSGANFEDLPSSYVEKLIHAIVAFEIEVTGLENVFKLSQNRDEKSYDNIISHLKKQGGDGEKIADQMENRKGRVFK